MRRYRTGGVKSGRTPWFAPRRADGELFELLHDRLGEGHRLTRYLPSLDMHRDLKTVDRRVGSIPQEANQPRQDETRTVMQGLSSIATSGSSFLCPRHHALDEIALQHEVGQ